MQHWELTNVYRSSAGAVRWNCLGDEGSDPVVLLHGTPFSSFVWRTIARALASRFRVYVWDMPGYGASEKYDGQDVSLASQGQVFTELLDHWGLQQPAVIAHDFGGAVSLRAHLLHGAEYRQLILVDPVALAPWGSPFFRLVGENTAVFEQLPPAIHSAVIRAYIRSASYQGLPQSILDILAVPWLGDAGQRAFYRQIAQANERFTDEIQDKYGDIRVPATVCWGAEDTWIPVAKGHELAGLIPGAQLRVIGDAGHLVQEDAPAELLMAIVNVLDG